MHLYFDSCPKSLTRGLCKYILMLILQILDIVVVFFLYCNQKSSRSFSSRKATLNFSNRSTDYLRIVVTPLRMVIHTLNKFPLEPNFVITSLTGTLPRLFLLRASYYTAFRDGSVVEYRTVYHSEVYKLYIQIPLV
jgi:hypothetical protein